MNNEDQLIDSSADDGLTDEERAADAAAVAADMGPFFAPLLTAKREKASRTGHKKRPDRRFKIKAGDDDVASPKANNSDEIWDMSPEDAFDEIRRISIAACDTSRPTDKSQLLLKLFNGRTLNVSNLTKLYQLSQRQYKGGGYPFNTLIVDLLVSTLAANGIKVQPESEKMTVKFGDEFSEILAVDKEAKS